ncbi:MAG: hypothetical protein NVS9B9_21770 [Ktedonobacteraceae bacterium]
MPTMYMREEKKNGYVSSCKHHYWSIPQMSEKRLDVVMSVVFFAIGFSPITALALAIIGVLPLPASTLLIVLPATALGLGLAMSFPFYGKLALKGLIIGLIAVFLYDCMRVPFIIEHVWGDFIPNINKWLFNTSQPNWVVGYIWRYLGDGGFMGVAFTVGFCVLKPKVDSKIAGLIFGVAIWICLVLTLLLAPYGQEMLFKLTITTMSLSLVGHLIYGIAIGVLHPFVCRQEIAGEALLQNAIVSSEDDWKELTGEDTIKLSPLLSLRPIWEQKTTPLPLGV